MKSLVLCCSLLAGATMAQEFPYKKLKEIKLQNPVDEISVDRLGGFYTANDCGIEQYSAEGKLQNKYLPKGCNTIDLFEAWPLMRLYAYQKSEQQFVVLDHQLELVDFSKIDDAFAVEPQLAAPASNLHSYWILDIDNSIKKIDLRSSTVSLESDDLKATKGTFTHMREYQNLLFLLDKQSGIFVINKLGKLVYKIDAPDIVYFSFSGEDLYYLKGNQLHFYDIFTKDSYQIEVPAGNKFAVATDERLILIKDGQATMYEFAPHK